MWCRRGLCLSDQAEGCREVWGWMRQVVEEELGWKDQEDGRVGMGQGF